MRRTPGPRGFEGCILTDARGAAAILVDPARTWIAPPARTMSWPKSLSQKLILFLTLVVGLVAIGHGWISVQQAETQLSSSMVLGAEQISSAITSATWHAMLADNRQDAYEVMKTIATRQGIRSIRIFNKEGRVMFATPKTDAVQVDKKAEACFLCHASERPLVKVDVPSRARIIPAAGGGRTLALVTPIYNEPSCSSNACHAHPASQSVLGVLDVGLDMALVDRQVNKIRIRTLLVTIFTILLVGVGAALFIRWFVAVPIAELIAGTRAVAELRLDRPIVIDSSEELADLARSFNVMRERLAGAHSENDALTRSLEAKVAERTEQLRVAQQKLLQADRLASLGQLAASVAHEINNPLSGVLNLSMLMQRIVTDEGIPKGREQEFRRYLGQVVNETARTGRIVSDLLSFSRRSKPQRARADVNAIVRSTVSLVSHKLKLMNVDCEVDLGPDVVAIQCDPSQLQQVVMNLVLNGAEATRKRGSGRIAVRTRRASPSGGLELVVQDDGEGISPELLPRIFDPFFTTKEDGKGVGLGLAVVYGIVKAHGGEIDVESRPGLETVFSVTLPPNGEESHPTPAPAA